MDPCSDHLERCIVTNKESKEKEFHREVTNPNLNVLICNTILIKYIERKSVPGISVLFLLLTVSGLNSGTALPSSGI